MKNLIRVFKIIYILHKYNILSAFPIFGILGKLSFFFNIHKKNNLRTGERLALALENLGPIFVKIGQSLSVRSDILGEEISNDLTKLQDRLAPFTFEQVKNTIKKQYNCEISQLFLEFSENPVAAASIAQVHYAKLNDGTEVAVKILRPGIKKLFARDMNLLFFIASLIERFIKNSSRLRATEFVNSLKQNIAIELDLNMEAAASSTIAEYHKDDTYICIPKIYWEYTNNEILTMAWVKGFSIYDTEAIKHLGLDTKIIACNLAKMFFYQAYEKGFYHSDLHPGNILLNEKGQIILLDFGIMGRLEDKIRMHMAEILYGFFTKNYELVAKVYFKAGFVPKNKSLILLTQSLRAISEPIVDKPVNQVSIAKLIGKLLKLSQEFEMVTYPELFALQKTMTLVEKIGYKLNQEINMWQLARPWIEDWAIRNIGLEAKILKTGKSFFEKLMERID